MPILRYLRRPAAALAGLSLFLALPAAAQEVRLALHHFLPATSTTHAGFLAPWAERVAAASGGRIAIDIYPAMQLGGTAPGLYDQVREGVVDLAWTLPGYTPGRFPVMEVFELPFVAASAEATSQAAQAFYERHADEVFADVHVLLVHTHAPGTFHIRGHAVTALDDLAGLQVRAPSRVSNRALAALGATPVGMPVPEVPQALSRGVIDAALLPWEVALSLRIHELADHHTEIVADRGLYTAVFLLAMNLDAYQAMPPDLRAILDGQSGLPLAADIGRLWDDAEKAGRDAAVAAGNTIDRIAEPEVARWRQATEGVVADWIAEMAPLGIDGQALLEEARALIAQYDSAP